MEKLKRGRGVGHLACWNGRLMRSVREKRGVSALELCQHLARLGVRSVATTTVYNWELGRSTPQPVAGRAVARALRIPFSTLTMQENQ